MQLPDLTEAQRRALGPEVRLIEACPGAGKTRVLVHRYIERPYSEGKGTALISFTNAAIDEVTSRCSGSTGLLEAPNYVGTIDSFLNRFIVTPYVVSELSCRPTYLSSWDSLSDAEIRLHNVPGAGIRMSVFRLDAEMNVTLISNATNWQEDAWLTQVRAAGQEAALLARVRSRMLGLIRSGVISADAGRALTQMALTGEHGPRLLTRLAGRFEELLLDEAQDCDSAEIDLVERLQAAGVRTTLVADPDQAIYEFRGAHPSVLLDYKATLADDAVVPLTDNHRSSDAICRIVSSLRAASPESVEHVAGDGCASVFVLSGDAEQMRAQFAEVLREEGLAPTDGMVLAHRHADATLISGAPTTQSSSRAAGTKLCLAAKAWASTDDAGLRHKLISDIENILLSLIDWPDELKDAGRVTKADALFESQDRIRVVAAEVLQTVGAVVDRGVYGEVVRAKVTEAMAGANFPFDNLPGRLRPPVVADWEMIEALGAPPSGSYAADSIHGAKGREYEAVMIALPRRLPTEPGGNTTVLDVWGGAENVEARRVLYVGASRAKRLLAIAAGDHADQVAERLAADDVPFTKIDPA